MTGPTHIGVALARAALASVALAAMTASIAASAQTANLPGEAPASVAPAPPAPTQSGAPAKPAATVPVERSSPAARAAHKHRRRHRPRSPQAAALSAGSVAAAAAGPSETAAGDVNAQVGEMGASVMSILGRKVLGPRGEDLGRVVDVLADSNGRVRVAIIDFGGFLGVGNHRIAVDWPLLRFDPSAGDTSSVTLAVSREKLQAAPEYKESEHPRVLLPSPVAASANAAEDAHANRK